MYLEQMTVDDVYLSFLPLAHILDRVIEEYFFHKGASVGFFHGVFSCFFIQYEKIFCYNIALFLIVVDLCNEECKRNQ